MNKTLRLDQVWEFGGIKWVIGKINFDFGYVTLIPVNRWNDPSNLDDVRLMSNELLRAGEVISENINDYLLSNVTDTDTVTDTVIDTVTDERKHSHYYKDVRHLDYIDIYRFCDLFLENDPSGALHHAIKKLAAAGRRGAGKDELKDLKEAADTINRKIEMLEEDKLKK